ncbi:ribosomal RNA large subunit methyltransferase K [Candidatus Phycosocius bacilliformis]|uniref:Ribosomal RNA large subunit methyltransferase K n=1 Tax=Candidatus Phycosocius bacilliformis TaxID=1445552 RepID=A0A2P2E6Y1_9PROT|nr:class I SAM-dependent methyltransferase [Candidatus Phycosocius bacilliformis]GBF56813.1 ribosomal RNA large subunit methyltransferase K [Candidatus Phycosocius bacilliformis]
MVKKPHASSETAIAPAGTRLAPVLLADDWTDYALLDSGDGHKLERLGPYVFMRPDSQALWPRRLHDKEWVYDAAFSGQDSEELGRWRFVRRVPETWPVSWGGIRFHARCTPFRHLGLFPEQSVHWRWCRDLIGQRVTGGGTAPKILNLFGYTGVASLVCAAAGAQVTHVDASKKAVGFARENQALAGLDDRPIRWIVDDALKFVEREIRRGNRYHGIILDPPKHGRGPNGEIWKLEEGLDRLLTACAELLEDDALFLVATVYAVRLSFLALENGLAAALDQRPGQIEAGEMALVEQNSGRLLPTAIFARWSGPPSRQK